VVETKGVDRQIENGKALAVGIGWTIGHIETESDVSTYVPRLVTTPEAEPWCGRRERNPKRPQY